MPPSHVTPREMKRPHVQGRPTDTHHQKLIGHIQNIFPRAWGASVPVWARPTHGLPARDQVNLTKTKGKSAET